MYTSYIAKLKDIPEEYTKLIITRHLPPSFNIDKIPNCHRLEMMSPSKELLARYKKDGDWESFQGHYWFEIMGDIDANDMLHELAKQAKKQTIVLVCYEKDETHCHRSILAGMLRDLGTDVKEFSKGAMKDEKGRP
jgi:uncharacterized protein YeaO (DUF488 family)